MPAPCFLARQTIFSMALAAAWFSTMNAFGQNATAPTELEAKTFQSATGGKTLSYRFLTPLKIEESKKYPLLLCLHGAGERGNNNTAQVGHFSPLFSATARAAHPCYVVIPQVPSGQIWATYGWSTKTNAMAEKPSETMSLAKELVDETIKKHAVDPKRIYVTGLSMGGYGTWEFTQRWPEIVAAAAPVCGGGDLTQAARLKDVPIWAFHGDKDTVIKPEASSAMIDALKSAGGKPKFTLYPGVGHNSWAPAFRDAELLKWMFAQKKE